MYELLETDIFVISPEIFEDRCQQNGSPAPRIVTFFTSKAEKGGNRTGYTFANGFGMRGKIKVRGSKATENTDRHTGLGTGSEDGIISRRCELLHPF